MKKLLFTTLIFMISILFFVTPIHADMGPKPSLTVSIKGVDQDYYFDLLVYVHNDVSTIPIDDYKFDYYYDITGYPSELTTFQLADGYASYFLFGEPSNINQIDTDEYLMNYIAPSEFRIVIVIKDTGSIIVSEPVKTTRFESDVTWDLSGIDVSNSVTGVGSVSGNVEGDSISGNTWLITTLNVLIRIVLTLAIELLILYFLFKVHTRKEILLVGLTNIVTQVTLSALVVLAYLSGGMIFYIISLLFLEVLVTLAEFIVYIFILKKPLKPFEIFLYAVVANFASFTLTAFIPVLF